jgi:DNA-binding GntR family transcriptional regulator
MGFQMTRARRSVPARSVNDPTAKGKGPPIDRLFDESNAAKIKSRTEVVHEALRQAILEQRLKPGSRLPEDQIGATFGTSRTIAREALGRLAVEGIVELKHNRGAFVANPSPDEGRHTFFVRRGLERLVTDSLAGKLKNKDLARLRAVMARERSATRGDPKEAIRLAGEFHTTLACMTGNTVLARFVSEVVCRCSLVLAMYAMPHSAEGGVAEHEAIVHALVSGSAAKAGKLMDDHLTAVADRAFSDTPVIRDDLRGVLAPFAARLND